MGRWHLWLERAILEAGCSTTALANQLQLEIEKHVDLSNPSDSTLHDRAPRASINRWRKGGYATPRSAFYVGQALSRMGESRTNGVQALYGAGHRVEAIACLDGLISRVACDYAKQSRAPGLKARKAAVEAMFCLDVALVTAVRTPIAFADLDGVPDAFIPAQARDECRAHLAPEIREFVNFPRPETVKEWKAPFSWATSRELDLEGSSLLVWSLYIDHLTLRAQHDPALKERWAGTNLPAMFSAYRNAAQRITPMRDA